MKVNAENKVTDPELLAILNSEESEEGALRGKPVTDPELLAVLNDEPPQAVTPQAQQSPSMLDKYMAAGQVGTSMASSMLAEPVAGVAGALSFLGGGADRDAASGAAETVEGVREGMTFTPKDPLAQEYMSNVGETLAPVGEFFDWASSTLGDTTMEWTGNPELAAVAYSIPTAVAEGIGLKGLSGVKKFGTKQLREAQKDMLTDPKLYSHEAVADVKLSPSGEVVPNPRGIELIESGLDRSSASQIVHTDRTTKKMMRQMVDLYEKGLASKNFAVNNKVSEVLGGAVSRRLGYAHRRRMKLGNDLNNLVKGPLGKKRLDVSGSLKSLNSFLADSGVKPSIKNGNIYLPKKWQEGTPFATKTMAPARAVIEDAYTLFNDAGRLGVTNVKHAHRLKKSLDELIESGKLQGVDGKSQAMGKVLDMRREINTALSGVEKYGDINKELSGVIEAMKPFDQYRGAGQKWGDSKVKAVVGQALKEMDADSAKAIEFRDGVSSLDSYIKSTGVAFNDSPADLVGFKRTLDNNFNTVPGVSSMSDDLQRAAVGGATSATVGNVFGLAHDAARMIGLGLKKSEAEKIAKKNDKALKAIKNALDNP